MFERHGTVSTYGGASTQKRKFYAYAYTEADDYRISGDCGLLVYMQLLWPVIDAPWRRWWGGIWSREGSKGLVERGLKFEFFKANVGTFRVFDFWETRYKVQSRPLQGLHGFWESWRIIRHWIKLYSQPIEAHRSTTGGRKSRNSNIVLDFLCHHFFDQ